MERELLDIRCNTCGKVLNKDKGDYQYAFHKGYHVYGCGAVKCDVYGEMQRIEDRLDPNYRCKHRRCSKKGGWCPHKDMSDDQLVALSIFESKESENFISNLYLETPELFGICEICKGPKLNGGQCYRCYCNWCYSKKKNCNCIVTKETSYTVVRDGPYYIRFVSK